MKKQANKYCSREARRVDDRAFPRKHRHIYTQKCIDEVMGKIVAQINEPQLTAIHSLREVSLSTSKSSKNKHTGLD